MDNIFLTYKIPYYILFFQRGITFIKPGPSSNTTTTNNNNNNILADDDLPEIDSIVSKKKDFFPNRYQ